MKASLHETREAGKGSILFSLAAHVVLIALIASITFRYPFMSLFREKPVQTERIQYVEVRPQPAQSIGSGSATNTKPKKAAKAVQLVAPTAVPTELPPVAPATPTGGDVAGTGTGGGGTEVGVGTSVNPSLNDPRIELRPSTLRMPLSVAAKNDSAVKAIFMAYREAEIAAEENRGRSPRDWTIERNGQKYGLDSQYIYLGKFKLPSAILAALPFNTGGVDGARLRANRQADFIRDDIYSHSQGLSEDDFRAAIKRIRERKDKERQEAEGEKKESPKVTPIVP